MSKVVAKTKDVRELKGIVPKPPKPVSVERMNRVVQNGTSRGERKVKR